MRYVVYLEALGFVSQRHVLDVDSREEAEAKAKDLALTEPWEYNPNDGILPKSLDVYKVRREYGGDNGATPVSTA